MQFTQQHQFSPITDNPENSGRISLRFPHTSLTKDANGRFSQAGNVILTE